MNAKRAMWGHGAAWPAGHPVMSIFILPALSVWVARDTGVLPVSGMEEALGDE
jgi:hypothetical protein